MWQRITTCFVLSTCLIAGCDKESDTSSSGPPEPLPAPVDILAVHPTTQQLLSAPRTLLELKFAPVTLLVPPGWELKSYNQGSLVTVEGSTPTDLIGISVPVSRTISADQEKALETDAGRDFSQHPELLSKIGVRTIAGAKVIERLILDPVLPSTQPAAPTTEPIQTMQWIFSVCVPTSDGKRFTVHDLRFLGMTLKQYKADQAFLRPIIDSIAYTPTADSPPT